MHTDAFRTHINLYRLHIPHYFDLLSDIFKGNTVEVPLTTYTDMVCAAQFYFFTHEDDTFILATDSFQAPHIAEKSPCA